MVEVVRHTGQGLPLGRLRRQPQTDAIGVDDLQGLIDEGFIHLDGLAAQIEVFLADASAWRQVFAAFEVGPCQVQCGLPGFEGGDIGADVGDLIVDVLHGVFELVAIAACLAGITAHLGLRRHPVPVRRRHRGLLDRNLDLIGLLVELDQQVALFHAVIVIHQDLHYLPRHPGRHKGHMAVHIGVIGRNRRKGQDQPRYQENNHDNRAEPGPRPHQPFSPWKWGRRWRVRRRLRRRRRRCSSHRQVGWPRRRSATCGRETQVALLLL